MDASSVIAVIGDIVNSRDMADRAGAQRLIEAAFAESGVEAADPLQATVGDEFQVVYTALGDAVVATTAAMLGLPAGLELRFGLGAGLVRPIGEGGRGPLQDGPGWWSARDAINESHRREDAKNPSLRSWFVSSTDPGGPEERLVNSYFLARDQIVSRMNARARRVALGVLHGSTQAEIARVEGVTQSAVSQSLQSSGAMALVDGLRLLGGARVAQEGSA
ncbi:SatD family protein [Frondihabitans sp. PhB188]|uniref:SatD family protein n=1 Tax=Frondihabitans sp. PhB188 TaxID=2485200 RepID=UPI000F4A4405|nr:SatD family protein [Frondihabitans sp. PhB188]ROQ40742.1 SatD family protein [Frondihabitans sp. PhB188]